MNFFLFTNIMSLIMNLQVSFWVVVTTPILNKQSIVNLQSTNANQETANTVG